MDLQLHISAARLAPDHGAHAGDRETADRCHPEGLPVTYAACERARRAQQA
jgi:hypothetical protein